MTIDRARNSYDATRDWRAVLAQQGRVTLEADINEQTKITGEERRREAIDVIGPVGSPDGGYAVSVSSDGGDVLIGPGTLYLGGWRATLPPPAMATASQPGWLDMPPWPAPTGNQSVALLRIEQTVIAVEDTALLEVALGGPDSAGRLRLLQHVLRIPTTAATCLDAATGLAEYAKTNGQVYDQATGELTSTARLEVAPVNVPTTPGPCDPPAQGGYLQADNQMIRVAVTQYDPTSRQGTLVWGWNNASFLYRATLGPNNVLTFLADPVDPDHQPQQGQAVEILRCTVDLGDGDRSTAGGGNFIAAGSGVIMTLAAGQGYNSASRQLTLPGNLQPPYTTDGARPLFVRLWQAQVAFSAGTAVTLGDTGLSVTITNPPLPGAIGARPFWQFAVRPSTPAQVYPQRYLTAGQPPDGPRQFLAELGVVGWSAGKFSLIADCVPPFVPLTKQPTGCCAVVLGPADVTGRGGLQAVVDSLKGSPAVVSLRPGTYTLTAPLVLGPQHAGLVLEGCSGGVILQAATADVATFLYGMIVMQNVSNITLRRLDLTIPAVTTVPTFTAAGATTLVGLGIAGAQSLTIEDCTFALDQATATSSGSGIFAIGALSNIVVRRSTFSCAATVSGAELTGFAVLTSTGNATTTLDAAHIDECQFLNLLIGVLSYAQLGLVRCTGNVITGTVTGFLFSEANLGATNSFVKQAQTIDTGTANASLAEAVNAGYKVATLTDVVNKAAPIIAKLSPTSAAPTISSVAQQALSAQYLATGQTAFTGLTAMREQDLAARVAPGATVASEAAAVAPPPTVNAAAAVSAKPVFQLSEAALNAVDTIAVAAETAAPALTPALRFDGNEVMLAATTGTPGVGLAVVLAVGGQPGSVMVNSNRILVPNGNTSACVLLFPTAATVIGNLFSQLAPASQNTAAAPTLGVLSERESRYLQIAGNISHPTDTISPTRTAPSATGSWEFLNTVI